MSKYIFAALCLSVALCLPQILDAQKLVGKVMDEEGENLMGAAAVWLGTNIGAISDANGVFQLNSPGEARQLVVSYMGFRPDTQWVQPAQTSIVVLLAGGLDIEGVEVVAKQRDTYFSTVQHLNVEMINAGELKKAACCNLSESFETSGTVNVSYTDAVTGAKEIEMLGLRGVYTQMLLENRPIMRGLAYTFGMEYVPGTWIKSIAVSKGASTTAYGYESVAGQINTELIKPFEGERFFLNGFANQMGRLELNLHANRRLGQRWSIGTLLHGSGFRQEVDANGDGFRDMPLKRQLNGMLRAFYRGDDWFGQLNVQALDAEHLGGQMGSSAARYRADVLAERQELFGKLGYAGFRKPGTSIGFIYGLARHRQAAQFGLRPYAGLQRTAQASLFYESIVNSTEHQIRLGGNVLIDSYEEQFDALNLDRTERLGGLFGEYTHHGKRHDLTLALRGDWHNQFGLLLTPRANFKYTLGEGSVLRASLGRGYRTAQILAENINVLVSNRALLIEGDLDVEAAWNAGFNVVKNTQIAGRDWSFNLDLYHTRFDKQIILNLDRSPDQAIFSNLDGQSFASSFLLSVQAELFEGFEAKAAYKFSDVRNSFDGALRDRPLVPRHRALVSLSYEAPRGWKCHLTPQWIGPQRLPDLGGADLASLPAYRLEGRSPSYLLLNAQVNKSFGAWELYLGGENLGAYRQEAPLIGAQDPFGLDASVPAFDAAQVFAPIFGPMVYGGFRYTLL